MDIPQRMTESTQRFESQKAIREQHLTAAEEAFIEMTKLQGEYRLLQEMMESEKARINKRVRNNTASAAVTLDKEGA